MKFILWLYIASADGIAIRSEVYASAKTCSHAGSLIVQGFSDVKRTNDIRFVCTPYNEPAL